MVSYSLLLLYIIILYIVYICWILYSTIDPMREELQLFLFYKCFQGLKRLPMVTKL